jgi:DNA-binding NarL/FixJ family response regulator
MRVLIAHANEATRSRLADVVTRGRRFSLDILGAVDGPEVLELLLADDPPEVALIDWDLPGIEAPEMCRLVRDFHHHHDTWIIVLASRTHQETAREVWTAGADDCVYTPAPAKLLSDRVTKGLCEMAPPIREAAAAAQAAAAAAALEAVAHEDDDAAVEDVTQSGRPTLDAVYRPEVDVSDERFDSLTADLKATVDPEDDDLERPAELAAGPVLLSAQRVDPDEVDDRYRGPATLDAVLARL